MASFLADMMSCLFKTYLQVSNLLSLLTITRFARTFQMNEETNRLPIIPSFIRGV